ncbi:N-acetylmuramoyl-L-alanine amidase family protein [Flavobacterium cerinum]|uniref:N-acetylmuramoyl-L-alanine amidase n=1 Tax=Flavobacterium cerinum TaxID=2502784 RepID=A0A3S3R111_9FLAO|nr:N-acetylmuramoyl-L-alanine amidase [Flavobacterium cerinum]RWX01465.1 N-acetylmuramoyl-L-alanine amidase [Flavobacterium cerinum]
MKLKLAFLTFIIFSTASFGQGNSKFKVVLDPGHGGKDYGAIYHGFIEKNIALNVALKVGKLLEKDPAVDVIFTRKTDVFIELTERPNIANKADANLFVSIHCNGEVKKTAFGTETFVIGTTKNASQLEVAKKENSVITLEKDYKVKYAGFDPNAPETLIGITIQQEAYRSQSIDLASRVEEIFKEDLNRNKRGVKQAPFWVLHKTAMPSILIEMGFISYLPEGTYLNSDEGQDDMAKAIAKAILSYKKEYFVNGDNSQDETPVIVIDKKQPKVEKPEVVEKPSKNTESNTPAASAKGVVFKVQIAASGKTLELVPSNFNGLSNITKDASSAVIKYYYGDTSEYNNAKELQEQAKAKGYSSAFIVAFKDGKKITVQEALKK